MKPVAIIQTLFVELIVTQRLYAIHNGNNRIRIIVFSILAATALASLITTIVAYTRGLNTRMWTLLFHEKGVLKEKSDAQDTQSFHWHCNHSPTDLNWAAWSVPSNTIELT